jgi:hypothetical protein
MKRLVLITASALVAGGVAAAPAVAGLAGNPSFSHQIPVRVPSQVRTPQLVDDHSRDARPSPTATHSHSATRHAEPGDDRGGETRHAEPGDDRGGPSRGAEPGDDRGGASEPGDDSGGGHGGSGSDDNSGTGSDDGSSHG